MPDAPSFSHDAPDSDGKSAAPAGRLDRAARSLLESLERSTSRASRHDIPERFQLDGDLRNQSVHLESHALSGDGLAYGRVTRMRGGGYAQALNALWLPRVDRPVPAWNCELLTFQGHLHLLQCDAYPLADHEIDRQCAENITEIWQDILTTGEWAGLDPTPTPDWGHDDEPPAFSEHALFTKPGASAGHNPTPGADLLETVAGTWSEVLRQSQRNPARASRRRSRRSILVEVHRRCEPTAEFLGRLTDEATIEKMKRSFLYPDWLDDETSPSWIDTSDNPDSNRMSD